MSAKLTFVPLDIPGAFEVRTEPLEDTRGHFARTFCRAEFEAAGLVLPLTQFSVSSNRTQYTLRGMHMQAAPATETKLVRAERGAAYDVIVDLRPSSPAFRRWCAVTLDANLHNAVYIPQGCAHGFLTLVDDTVLHYQITPAHDGRPSRGVRFDDPAFGIDWPASPRVISERDATYPDFDAP